MGGGAWWAAVHGVAKSRTRLSDFPFPFHFHALEKEMATHSSVLAWRIPGTGEPGGLPSVGSHRVGHDWSDLAAAAAAAISSERITLCSLHFILSVWGAWYEKKKKEKWGGGLREKRLGPASCLKRNNWWRVLKRLFRSLFNLMWLAMSSLPAFKITWGLIICVLFILG